MSLSAENVAEVRHVVQQILVPFVFLIGLVGNSVSIYVLTRRRMRCTTNIYLTALAITDLIYLAMAFLLSLQHYPYIHLYCKIYWQYYGVVLWLCDACAYISIYIAVCFTIERFIAIRYPLKRQTFCTEALAKKVITAVALFCLLSTVSTAFEHQYGVEFKLINADGSPCNLSLTEPLLLQAIDHKIQPQFPTNSTNSTNSRNLPFSNGSLTTNENENDADNDDGDNGDGRGVVGGEENNLIYTSSSRNLLQHNTQSLQMNAKEQQLNGFDLISNSTSTKEQDILLENNCQNMTYYIQLPTALGANDVYLKIWYFLTLFIFVLIPLCVLVTFNCFLIMLVRRSKIIRGEMTNANSIRRSRRKSHTTSVSQENRVTITLIAVVLLFIICQLPWAIYLIVSAQISIEMNLQAVIGNIFNFLAALNAASNFFLYCVLSDKYRKTVREMITACRYGQHRYVQGSNCSQYNSNNTTSFYTHCSSQRSHRPSHNSLIIK